MYPCQIVFTLSDALVSVLGECSLNIAGEERRLLPHPKATALIRAGFGRQSNLIEQRVFPA